MILRISSLLDEVSLLFPKTTNARFRDIIERNEKQLSRCVEWKMLTLLERDLFEQTRFSAKPFGLQVLQTNASKTRL